MQERRAARLQQLALVWEVLAALGVAGSAGLYARYQAWQALVVLATALVCSLLCRVSRRLSLAHRTTSAGAFLLLVSVSAPLASTVLVSGMVPVSAVLALVLPVGTAALVWPDRPVPRAPLAGAAAMAWLLLLDRVWPFDRLDVTRVPVLVFPIVALSMAGVAALLWNVASIPPGRRLRIRLLSSFLLVGALPMLVAWTLLATGHRLPYGGILRADSQGTLRVSQPAVWIWTASIGLGGAATSVAIAYRLAAQVAEPFGQLASRACDLGCGGSLPSRYCGDEEEALAAALDAMERTQSTVERETARLVAARTHELERRCRHAEAVGEIAAAGLRLPDARHFCREAVGLIREQLALRYAGVYTMTAGEPWAELVADSGGPGWQGPNPPARTRVGEGFVGRCIGEAALVVDSTQGSPATQELCEGRAACALGAAIPLRSRGQALGAIVVYAEHPAGLDRELLDALQAIGRLVAMVLDNIRALKDGKEALLAAQRAAGQLSLEAWAQVVRARTDLSFRGHERGVERVTGSWSPRMLRAARDNATVFEAHTSNGGDTGHLTVPIQVQGEVIGVLDTTKPAGDGFWTSDQVALVEQIAEQLSQALENARLYEETQRRGVRERQLREIGTRIGSGVDLDTILQTAIEDVARALGVPAAFVQLYEGSPVAGAPTE